MRGVKCEMGGCENKEREMRDAGGALYDNKGQGDKGLKTGKRGG